MRENSELMLRSRAAACGFTIIELVVVIGIAAVLAAFAFTRINVTSFDAEGFANRAAAMVRYAQKIAISQRRTVFVRICLAADPVSVACPSGDNRLVLCYTDAACVAGAVREPPGTNAFSFKVPSGVTLAGTSFSFNALGKPSAGGTITVTGDVARTITIEAETGYVH